MTSAFRARPLALPFLVTLLLGACSRPQVTEAPVQPTAPTAATPAVEPEPGLLRAAERIELRGNELGSMWTFENAPLDQWEERYGFRPDAEWLDHVRLSSVRMGTFCSASFVSPEGLVMTNHHCARGCVEAVSSATSDYLEEGFYAATREQEVLCPNLYLDQLAEIEDVTARVRGATGTTDRETADAQQTVRTQIEDECEAATEFECQVVTLYHGGQYQLYRYRRYAPVKLVFAPELQAGFYGGDPDNFTYPRYALDVSFVRAYEPDGVTPVNTSANYFRWDEEGADEGELVFITGNPGTTSRGFTVSQVLYERNVRHPLIVQAYTLRHDALQAWAARGTEQDRQVRQEIFGLANTIKAYSGQLAGLQDTLLMARKIRWENEFRDRIRANPELQRQYGDVWNRIAALQPRLIELRPRAWLYQAAFLGSPHETLGNTLVNYVRQTALPEAERSQQFRGEALERVRTQLTTQQLDAEFSIPLLANRFEMAQRWLPASDFLRQAMRAGETPLQAATRIIGGTRLGDVAFRRQVMEGGVAALESTTDPLLALMARMNSEFTGVLEQWNEQVAQQTVLQSRLAQALFGAYGTQLPPDATFTLRISDGVVQGYEYNGTLAPAFTTFFGMYDRAAAFDNEMPFTLPESFVERREHVDMSTRFDMVTTNDITGGNSGSPMIDRDAHVVGIAFDGNIEQLPTQFLYSSEGGARTVAVHSAGILEALRSIYQAERIVDEITSAAD